MPSDKVDRLSLLPTELLDYIFELANSSYSLSSVPPSRHLRQSHERALYLSVRIRTVQQLALFSSTLGDHHRKQQLVRRIFYDINFPLWATLEVDLTQILPIAPNLLEIAASPRSSTHNNRIRDLLGDPTQYASLVACRFPGEPVPLEFVERLGRFPNLRRVEIASLYPDFGEPRKPGQVAEQVEELLITSGPDGDNHYTHPSEFFRAFPSAKIVSLDYVARDPSTSADIVWSLTQLSSTLRILRLRERPTPHSQHSAIRNLADFTLLEELHLDDPFFPLPAEFSFQLLHLKNLVTLSIVDDRSYFAFVRLFEGPERLRRLRHLDLNYYPLEIGSFFDMELAEREFALDDIGLDEPGLHVLDDLDAFVGVALHDWDIALACDSWDPEKDEEEEEEEEEEKELRLLRAARIEEVARRGGIVVKSNFEEARQVIHRHLVEYYGRAIARFYFYGVGNALTNANTRAEALEMELPKREIDFDKKYDRGDLEWYKVDMEDVVGCKCETYNLRYRRKQ